MVSSHLGPPVSAVRGALAEWSHNAGKSRLHPACYERTLTMVSSHGPPVSAVRGLFLRNGVTTQESPGCTPRASFVAQSLRTKPSLNRQLLLSC